ncbi:MAG: hypothetical protein K0A98_07795 [Trueperaceae bacterium]|nr:hypothetical protein [Trueperaceae bacterium]
MAEAYRYPLTRICIRTGSLTLPLNLLGVFPERGDVLALDPQKDVEFTLRVDGRRVLGLGPFFEAHELTVNDELHIRPQEDGRFAITAVLRPRRPDFTRPDVVGRLLDELVEAGLPMSEAEIREMHGELPSGFPLRQALERDARLVLREGRWQPRLPEAAPADAPDLAMPRVDDAGERARPERRPEVAKAGAGEREAAARAEREAAARAEREAAARAEGEDAARARAEVEAALEAQAAREAEIMAMVEADELAQVVGSATAAAGADIGDLLEAEQLDDARRRTRERLAAHAEDDVQADARRQRDRRRGERAGGEDAESFSWDQPLVRRLRLPWGRRREEAKEPASEAQPSDDPLRLDRLGEPRPVERTAPPAPRVSPAPRAGLFAADAGLNSASLPPGDPAKTKRAREAFTTLGYRVEGLAHGQLMLHADYGRRFERVLVHVLPDGQRLDWAALLARRRESGATHMAVVGDHRDLHRLVAPADLAKATLWSWAGLQRVIELSATMPLGPFDLAPHFERDGLFEYGLDRFERTVAKRVQERGTFSAVLERLALMKAPAVFMLEDVAGSADVPREQALRVLERLCDAPWHLVSRVDSGEFCLRYRVHDALDQIGAYAASLRARLPERQRDRVRGLPDDVAPIEAADVVGDGLEEAVGDATGDAPAAAPEASAPKDAAASQDADSVPADAGAAGMGARGRDARARETRQAPLLEPVDQAAARPFAGPGLGSDEPEADEVDLSLVAVKRSRRRR